MKAIIVIILTAFTLGLLGETAVLVHSLLTAPVEVATAPWDTIIEVVVCWLIVLCVFYHRIWSLRR